MIFETINVNKVYQSIVNKLEKMITIYKNTGYDVKNHYSEEIETSIISVEMNVRMIYYTFVKFRYSKHRKAYIFTFSDMDEAVDFSQNIVKISELINRFKIISISNKIMCILFTCETANTYIL